MFHQFAVDAGLRVSPESIRSGNAPQPDIICRTADGSQLGFELVQIVDQGMARDVSNQVCMQSLLREAYDALPRSRRLALRRRLRNALVGVWLTGPASRTARQAAVPQILAALEAIDPNATGELPLDAYPGLRAVVRRLIVSRGKFVGPSFSVLVGGSLDDPIVAKVRAKFAKIYSLPFPIELLAFYELQLPSPDSLWLSPLQQFVVQNLAASPFHRVWVYDAIERRVRYVFPAPGAGGAKPGAGVARHLVAERLLAGGGGRRPLSASR